MTGKLFLPKEFAPGQEALANGLVPEHYSWKKVTTSVSNFIMGSPTIDHYGDMVGSILLVPSCPVPGAFSISLCACNRSSPTIEMERNAYSLSSRAAGERPLHAN